MNKTIIVLIALALVFSVQAQNITNTLGGNTTSEKFIVEDINNNALFSILGDGNVGIGTDSPSTKLDVDGTVTATGGDSDDWNTAYGWGDHGTEGYLKTESDPIYNAAPAAGISAGDISNWNTAYGWGDHPPGFGNWTKGLPNYTDSTTYIAPTDGFVIIYGLSSPSDANGGWKIEGSRPYEFRTHNQGIYNTTVWPVRKGDNWEVTLVGSNTLWGSIWWLSLGN